MVAFEQAISNFLCNIRDEIKKIRVLEESKAGIGPVDTPEIYLSIPEAGGTRSFSVGKTTINFKTGVITNPNGSLEYMEQKLDQYNLQWLRSLSVVPDQDIIVRVIPYKSFTIASGSTNVLIFKFNSIEITCAQITNIKIWAGTNPDDRLMQSAKGATAVFLVSFVFSQLNTFVPTTVIFTPSVYGGNPPYTFLWNFGDSTTSNLVSPTKMYNTPGTYSITLTVTDNLGNQIVANGSVTATSQNLQVSGYTVSESSTRAESFVNYNDTPYCQTDIPNRSESFTKTN